MWLGLTLRADFLVSTSGRHSLEVHWNESVYCIRIDIAFKIRFNEGSGSFLQPTVLELWKHKLTWTSNNYISFTLKWHYCHVQFVDTQHNFEITYLQLNCTEWGNSHQRCSIKKALLKNFAIFTEKHLCWSLFKIKMQA